MTRNIPQNLTMSKSELEKLIALENANMIELVKIVNAVIGDGSPKGVFSNLFELEEAYPEGELGIYLVNGRWYYYDGYGWRDGGVYLSTGMDTINARKVVYDGLVPLSYNAKEAIDNTYSRISQIIAQSGTSSTEVVDARGGFPVLGGRLNDFSSQLADIVYNVKSYGAKGDGITNDTVAVMACVTASTTVGAVVYFPPGTYRIDGLRIQDKVVIRGAGIDKTTIKANPGANDLFFWIDSVDDSSVEDLTVDGNAANQVGGASLVLYKTRRSAVRNVKVINSYSIALNMSNCEDCIVDSCHLDGTVDSTVVSFSSDDVNYSRGNNKVVNCTIENGALDGIIYNVHNGFISGNTIRNNGAIAGNTAGGIYVNNKRNIILVNNVIYGNDGNGIDLISAVNAVIEGNTVFDNNSAGIMLSGSTHTTIADNVSYNNGKAPVSSQEDGISLIGACAHINVIGNICYDNQTVKKQPFGLDIASTATNITVINNNFIGNVNTDGIRNESMNDNVYMFGNLPFNKFTNSLKSFSFSLGAGQSFVLTSNPDMMIVVEIADQSLQTYGRYFLRGSNNGVQELDDPANAFEPSDTGTYNAIFHNGTNFVLKNKRSTTAYYSYMISYI